MYTGIKHLHSYFAYLVIIILVIALINAIIGWMGNKNFTGTDRKITLFALIATHIQFLIGILLYFVSPLALGGAPDMGVAMKDPTYRLYLVEHPLVMLIAVVLITVGFSKAKRMTNDTSKFRFIAIMYGLAAVLALSRIPWNAWLG